QRLLEPARNRPLLELSVGAPVAGIVEPQKAKAAPLGFGVERSGLGRVHVGPIAAEPNDAWASAAHWRAAAKGDTPLIRGVSDDENLRLSVRHIELAADHSTCGRRWDGFQLGRAGGSGLGGALAASQPFGRQALVLGTRRAVSLGALSPFGRGADAPLAGRTILQIVPSLAEGGDERATLAVTAALTETGARALVATDSRELAGELQAIGGLFIRFPAATKSPIAMALNTRRLQRIIAS